MRRYKLDIGAREFVIDVQELAADRFEVFVGGESYEVTLSSDEEMAAATITPSVHVKTGDAPAVASQALASIRKEAPTTPPESPTPRKVATTPGGKGTLNAPMPGVILEINVKAGDTVTRGQRVAILDAMKMHNVIGAPRAGTVAEVCVTVGQSVGHGDAIIRFAGE